MREQRSGQEIIQIGYAGTRGSIRILEEYPERIRQQFGKAWLCEEIGRMRRLPLLSFSASSEGTEGRLVVKNLLVHSADGTPVSEEEGDLAAKQNAGELSLSEKEDLLPGFIEDYGVSAVLPVGEGGVLSALWRLCALAGADAEGKQRKRGLGCRFRYDRISVQQLTVELCELFGLTPYRLSSEHCFLLSAEQGGRLCEALRMRGIRASVLGELSNDNKRLRTDCLEPAFLTDEHRDELERLSFAKTASV